MKPELNKIEEKIIKQWELAFLNVNNYPEWLANIVLVPKTDKKVRMYVNYMDLKKATKVWFPLTHIEVLVDNATCISFLVHGRILR